MKAYTADQISKALGVTKRRIQIRAVNEKWNRYFVSGLGGQIAHYKECDLPTSIQWILSGRAFTSCVSANKASSENAKKIQKIESLLLKIKMLLLDMDIK